MIRRYLIVLGAMAIAALGFASAAGAELGITGRYDFKIYPEFEFPSPGVLNNNGQDAAINSDGAGGVAPGTYYASDGSRIQQFSPNGDFVRLWGTDAVASGPGNADETQSVAIFATGGTFKLTFGGETTAPIAYDSSPGGVETALNALSSIGGVGAAVTVTGGPGNELGSTPYLVTFGGVQADAPQPLLEVDDGALTGPGATSFVASTVPGGTGREVCEPSNGDVCKGSNGFTNLAINQVNGHVVAGNYNNYEEYTATGQFLRRVGFDTVKVGPHDSKIDEQDTLKVKATGGTFILKVFVQGHQTPGHERQETPPVPWNASAAELEAAINAIPFFGTDAGGSVKVTGGPGDETGSKPYVITFGGVYAGDGVEEFQADPTELTGPGKSASILTTVQGGGAEVCTPSDFCNPSPGSDEGKAGSFSVRALTVVPEGAPNENNVLVADYGSRVQEFDPNGDFVRMFGWGVTASGPDAVGDIQTVRILSGGGTFALEFKGAKTGPLAANASASTVEAALNPLATIGGAGGTATVTAFNGFGFEQQYRVVLGGTLAGTDPPLMIGDSSGLEPWYGGAPRVEVGGTFSVCTPAKGDTCRNGTEGVALGQMTSRISGLAVDSTGAIYVVDGPRGNSGGGSIAYRVQKFTPAGSDLEPSVFGDSEQQTVTVNASGGSFRLGVPAPEGFLAYATINAPANVVSGYTTERGNPEVGAPIEIGSAHPGNRITRVTPQEIEFSKQTNSSCGYCSFTAAGKEYTADLPANASAAEVKAALDSLGAINLLGGSVSVSGGSGAPIVVTFDGGVMSQTDQPQLSWTQGSVPLSGGSNDVEISTDVEGGPNGRTMGSPETSSADDGETPIDIAVGPGDDVFVLRNVRAGWAECEEGPSFNEVRLLQFDSAGHRIDQTRPCAGIPQGEGFSSPDPRIDMNQNTGVPYVFSAERPILKETGACCTGGPRLYAIGDPGSKPTVTLDPVSSISPSGATIAGTINPQGPGEPVGAVPASTEYRVEYKKPAETNWQVYAPSVRLGVGNSPLPFSVGISGLTPKATYEARVVVTKPYGFAAVVGVTPTFTTLAAKPFINATSAEHVAKSSVDLKALINPLGTATTYHFEYGPTPDYGSQTPEEPIGDGVDAVAVTQHVEGLEPIVYHFRVVATNALGTVVSTDQTFNFYPEPCPNATVRQQTGSGSLPDCRAYELVSPENAGSSTLLPGTPPNSGEAVSPSRFAFEGAFGSIPGPWNPPNTTRDMYVATRTNVGWQTHYVGIPGDVSTGTYGPPNGEGDEIGGEGNVITRGERVASPGMDLFIGWSRAHQGFACCGLVGSMAPYVFDATNRDLGRWPTNIGEIPGGLKDIACWTSAPIDPCGPEGGFVGDEKVAADFSHYFFSSANVAFAEGGLIHGIGSAYDNDIKTGAVTIVSKLANGNPIEKEPGVSGDDYLALPAAARDGSSVLMAASGTGICGNSACAPMPFPCGGYEASNCPPLPASHLYQRFENSITYDVSHGHLVDYRGMSGDGSRVLFTSDQQITADDADSSVDLYQWSRATDTITRLSVGSGSVGNSDSCNSSWISRCGVKVLTPAVESSFEPLPYDKGFSRSGDVLFYSPEQFVGSNGIPGRRNLYYQHDGELKYIATLDGINPATRVQITPDGEWLAFVTRSRLTSYDNNGLAEMYRYEAASGELVCVSCIPSGKAPVTNVEGSQNGLFLTDDGRAFFATEDAVVPADTNGLTDVYEYVSGRPQLISTGIGQRSANRFVKVGLVGVSLSGADAFFSTFETLVPTDHNGAALKFYDARVGGGFPSIGVAAPCAAADECHGEGNPGMTAPRVGSTANLGSAGDLQPKAKKKPKKRKHKKKSRRGKRNGGKQGRHGNR